MGLGDARAPNPGVAHARVRPWAEVVVMVLHGTRSLVRDKS